MGEVIRKFLIVAFVGALFLAIFALAYEFTDIIPERHAEIAYFIFMTPWLVWSFFYFAIPLVGLFLKIIRRGS